MDKYVDHIEMEPDKLGNHTNISGVAVLDITFCEGRRVVEAKAISGHPIALSLLIGAVTKMALQANLGTRIYRTGVWQAARQILSG